MSGQSRAQGWFRATMVLGMLVGLLLAIGPVRSAGMAPGAPAQVSCDPHVYYDIYHDDDGDDANYDDLAGLIISDLGGTFDIQDQVIDAAALAGYNVLLILDTELALEPAEISAIADFVTGGGRLVVLGEWARAMNVAAVNDLLTGVGVYISLNTDAVHDPTNNGGWSDWPHIHQFASHHLTDGVDRAEIYVGASLNVEPPAIAIASGDDDTYTILVPPTAQQGDDSRGAAGLVPQEIYPNAPIVMAYSEIGLGNVFVVGDSDLWEDGDSDGDGVDNIDELDHSQLAQNAFSPCTLWRVYMPLMMRSAP